MRVTKIFTFNAAHFLSGHPTCGVMHGHTYKLEVTVAGPVNARGMVLDFSTLKSIVQEKVLANLDHTTLNNVLPEDKPPTAENLCAWIWQQIDVPISCEGIAGVGPCLVHVRLWETPTSYADLSYADAMAQARNWE